MRTRRSLKALIFLGVLVAVTAGAIFAFWPQIFALIEEEMIRAERARRWTLASAGQTLPGTPDLQNLSGRLASQGVTLGAPILIRIFKREFELEVWLKRDARFHRFATYPICMWSGNLGPKLRQGDRQAPEGFYLVSLDQMNPRSKYHLSFNVGFPNAYDRAYGRTGQNIMVHGDCTSAGCYAMTDAVVEEIFILAREALQGGQPSFQIQAFPFRMTAANMAAHKDDKWYDFWKNLKEGYDYFEISHLPPKIAVCEKRYLINASFTGDVRPDPAGACPAYQKLPIPRAPAMQEASAKPAKKAVSASLTKPLGSVLGLRFGPSKPAYSAFTLGPATPGR
jgi:murein L,D-transpeptidase YafK